MPFFEFELIFFIEFEIMYCYAIEDGRVAWREDGSFWREGHKQGVGRASNHDMSEEDAKKAKGYLARTAFFQIVNLHYTYMFQNFTMKNYKCIARAG